MHLAEVDALHLEAPRGPMSLKASIPSGFGRNVRSWPSTACVVCDSICNIKRTFDEPREVLPSLFYACYWTLTVQRNSHAF